MEELIKVHVVKYASCKNLMMRYLDPFTNKQVARSAGTTKQREAERVAAKWEAELREGRYQKRSRVTWEEFCERFQQEGMSDMRSTTAANYFSTFKAFESLTNPKHLADLTTERVARFARELRKPYTITRGTGDKQTSRKAKRTEASVARHLRHLKAAARWAHRHNLLLKLPQFDMPKKASGANRMKGRPITGEEFDRMLTATEKVVGKPAADSWKLLLRGLWSSGLRISEAMALRWDKQPGGVCVILNGHKSVLAFEADSQKSGKVQLVPLAPEAVELLSPKQKDSGFVFNPLREDGKPMRRDSLLASKTIASIGTAANVVVDPERGKCASAHDLRRSFGNRWSRRVMPTVLRELMRHSDINTTMNYYVGQSAESTAAELWKVLGKVSGKVDEAETQKSLKKKYTREESNL
ncbi:tyrosine-type recombinase/integrase [Bythopirellula polymerisocia]|uniref:tyrosine-type recombinase/integrase n=1 Tax=Bythopirellula polymerisocia TaxID=2528003 RepID=UPI0011B53497|nr:site-specific integrase [Bythopirellula polymerisocia]